MHLTNLSILNPLEWNTSLFFSAITQKQILAEGNLKQGDKERGEKYHMRELGNHPEIPNAVEIILRFTDFYNTVVINGKYCLNDIVHFLKKSEYISAASKMIRIIAVYRNLSSYLHNSYIIPLSDPIMNVKLSDFDEEILKYHSQYLETTNYLYHYIIEFVENV